MATLIRLKSGSWRAQVRRKGKYVNETFRRRKDAEEWALDIERRIDRQEPATTRSRDAKLVGASSRRPTGSWQEDWSVEQRVISTIYGDITVVSTSGGA